MSDVRTLATASVRQTLRRQRALIALMVGVVALLLVCAGVVGAGLTAYAHSISHRSALSLVQVTTSGASARPVDDSAVVEMGEVDGVVAVYPWVQVDLALSTPSDWPDPDVNPGAVWATPLVPGLLPEVVAGEVPADGLAPDEVVLPRDVPGGSLEPLLGRRVVFEFTKVVAPGEGEPAFVELTVVALIDNSVPGEAGQTPSYLAPAVVQELVETAGTSGAAGRTYSTAYVEAESVDQVPAVQSALADRGFAVSSIATQVRSLGGLFEVLAWARWIFAGVLVLVCLGLGGAIGATWAQQRIREIGLLKAVGWSRRRIVAALAVELGAVGAVAGAVGVLVGVVGSIVVTGVVAGRGIALLPVEAWRPPGTGITLLAFLLVPACVVLGGLRGAVRAANVDADDALRDL